MLETFGPHALTLLKETVTFMFSCEYSEILNITYFEEHLRTTASFEI